MVRDIAQRRRRGIDALEIIPLVDLSVFREETIHRIHRGLIPSSYRWSRKKTEQAYSYKNYGDWARCIIVGAKYYLTDEEYPHEMEFGRFARFTWRNNYGYITRLLGEFVDELSQKLGTPVQSRVISNYTSIPEKPLFRYSGLADYGKHSVLLHRIMGSYFVLGEIFTDIELETEEFPQHRPPDYSICGNCSLCIDSCPTGAIIARGTIDINRCLQYISENLLLMPRSFRELWGNRLYGCTTCIDVCPKNRNLARTGEKHSLGFVGQGMHLLDALQLQEKDWPSLFQGNQIGIRSYPSFIKNAITACGSLQYRNALEFILPFTLHKNELLRAYACWAIGRMRGKTSKRILQMRYRREESALVKSELESFF